MSLQLLADAGHGNRTSEWAAKMPFDKVALVPIYEYVCMSCESHFEELVGMAEPDPACPDCGNVKVAKQFSAFVAHGTAGQPSFGGGGCCGGSCGCC
ncbi:MAG TPA: zinc ribbon domain-containing protein [Gaiellaceae bacterium]|nr:zinc ribbon domain-containing protein [Gaiellaceae bacterium]